MRNIVDIKIVHDLTFAWIIVHVWTVSIVWTVYGQFSNLWTVVHRLWTVVHSMDTVHDGHCP